MEETFMRKFTVSLLCILMTLLAISSVGAQDVNECSPDSINTSVNQLIKEYQATRAKAGDIKATLDEIENLEKDLANLRDTCSKSLTSSGNTDPGDGSQDSPYAFGISGNTFNDYSLQITGQIRPADRILRNENMFNDRPENDEVYIILNLELVCDKQATKPCEANQYNFKLLGDMGIIYESPFVVYEKMIDINVVKGTTAKGDMVFKIKKDDTNLRLLFTPNMFDDDYIYYYAEPSMENGIQISSTAAVNVRSGAGKNFDVTGSLPANTSTIAFGRNADGTWLQIQEGWVFSDLVKVDGDIQTLPVTAQ
jgi:hypothetical protein